MFKSKIKLFLGIIGIIILLFFAWLFIGKAPVSENIIWGVAFSQKQSQDLGLDWKENYLAILDDLKIDHLKIIAYWDLIEPQNDDYYFNDLDFQIEEAEKRDAQLVFTLGRKVPRWPECHIPEWAKGLDKKEQEQAVLDVIEETVLRYRDSDSIWAWQIENEPFFNFGECPEITEDFLRKEVELVRFLDQEDRPIIISDSGSNRFWFKVARMGDIVSFSLYRKVWFNEFNNYVKYPFPPVFYWRKAQIIDKVFDKEVICGELQAEPWGSTLIPYLPFEEHKETMDLEKLIIFIFGGLNGGIG